MLLLISSLLLLVTVSAKRDENKIIGGQTCIPHSQPWQAAVFVWNSFHCGGVLLSNRWVLTAAHCAHWNLRVKLGKHNLKNLETSEQLIKVAQQIPYPSYNPKTNNHDLMLLCLEKPAKLTSKVRPIQLAKSCARPGTNCMVSGWGTISTINSRFPSTLQCLNIKIISDEICRPTYPGAITEGMVCAGLMRGGKDACQGDSGGPLVCNGALQGLVSWGKRCALPRNPGVYTNLCHYRNWIQREMRKKQN